MDSIIRKGNHRKSLTIEEKIDVLNKLENGMKNWALCEEYKVSASTISTIHKNKDKLKERYEELQNAYGNTKRKRLNGMEFEVLEKTVYAWLCQKRTIGEPVSGLVVQEKAKFFFSKMKQEGQIPQNARDFKASDGWLAKFKKRHGLRTLSMKGEKASGDTEASDRFIADFTQFLVDNNYELDNVYNADETGLQFQSLPDRTLILRNEEGVSGHKRMKDRLTIMVCANASGLHRIPLLVIGKAAKPRCFQRCQSLPTEYMNQNSAWMNGEIFQQWFRNIFLKNVRELKPHARIVLLLDNAPTHQSAQELNVIDDNCLVIYLPPNVTSLIQPMDQGVISAMKRHYKTGFLRDVLSQNHSSQSDFVQFVKKWTVLDCMNVLREAWNTLTPSTLRNSWKKLIPTLLPNAVDVEPCNTELVTLINHVPGGDLCSGIDVTRWLEKELKLPGFETMSDEQLLNTYAGLHLPLPEAEETQEGNFEEFDEPVDKSLTIELVLNATQSALDWMRGRIEFTDEERSALIKVRDLALDSLLTENQTVPTIRRRTVRYLHIDEDIY